MNAAIEQLIAGVDAVIAAADTATLEEKVALVDTILVLAHAVRLVMPDLVTGGLMGDGERYVATTSKYLHNKVETVTVDVDPEPRYQCCGVIEGNRHFASCENAPWRNAKTETVVVDATGQARIGES